MRFIALFALAALIAGCSPESKESYKEAGQAAATAAKKTSEAIAQDAKAVEPKIKQATIGAEQASKNALLKAKIKAALVEAPGIDAGKITIDVQGDKVVLGGNVPGLKEHKAAVELVETAAGGDKTVVDHIKIAP